MYRSMSKFVIPCLAGAAVLGLSAPAFSATVTAIPPGFEVVTRTVSYADLDLTHTQGVATLYARIKSVAHEVCDSTDSRGLQLLAASNRCRQQAIGHAVEDVHSATLTSLHVATTNPAGDAFHR